MLTCVPADDGNPVIGIETAGEEDDAGTEASGNDGDATGSGAGDDMGVGTGDATGVGAGGAGATATAGEVTVVVRLLKAP